MVCRPHRGIIMGMAAGYQGSSRNEMIGPSSIYSQRMSMVQDLDLASNMRASTRSSVDDMLYGSAMQNMELPNQQYSSRSYFSPERNAESGKEYTPSTQYVAIPMAAISPSFQQLPQSSIDDTLEQEEFTQSNPSPERKELKPELIVYEIVEDYSTRDETVEHEEELHTRQESLAKRILNELKDLESPGELALSAVEMMI